MNTFTLISNGKLIIPLNNDQHLFDHEITQLEQQGFKTLDISIDADSAEDAIEQYKVNHNTDDVKFVSLLAVMSQLMY